MAEVVYRFAEITETFGEYEATSKFVVSAPEDEVDDVLDSITYNFRGDGGSGEPDGSYDYERLGIRIQLTDEREITKEHFDILKLYLANLSPRETQNLENLG